MFMLQMDKKGKNKMNDFISKLLSWKTVVQEQPTHFWNIDIQTDMIKIVFSINNSITNDVDNVEVLNKSEYLRTKYSSSGELSFFYEI